jgi:CBS domain-containing protein
LVVLDPNTPTLLAYEQLAAAGVTGAPVLSSQGEVIANLSISDIRWASWQPARVPCHAAGLLATLLAALLDVYLDLSV